MAPAASVQLWLNSSPYGKFPKLFSYIKVKRTPIKSLRHLIINYWRLLFPWSNSYHLVNVAVTASRYNLNSMSESLQWRYNELDGVSNHQPHECLLNRWFRRRSKKTSKLRVTGLCAGNSPVTGPVTRKMFPFDDVIMLWHNFCLIPLLSIMLMVSHNWRIRFSEMHHHQIGNMSHEPLFQRG